MVELNKLGRGQAIKEASNQIDAERAPALSDSRSSEFELTFNIPIRWSLGNKRGRARIHYRNKPKLPLGPFPTYSIQPYARFHALATATWY